MMPVSIVRVMVVYVAVVFVMIVMMMPVRIVRVMVRSFVLPGMHYGHCHPVVMMVGNNGMSQQDYVGHQQHRYG